MGDMADFYIDQMMDAYPEWGSPYGYPFRRTEKKCHYCGEDGLEWANTGKRWILIDSDGGPHVCSRVATEDDFKDLT